MKTVFVTRTEPVFIEDDLHCSVKCLHYGSQIPRCYLFQVDIPLDEEDRRPRRLPACRNAEDTHAEDAERDRLFQKLVDTVDELSNHL